MLAAPGDHLTVLPTPVPVPRYADGAMGDRDYSFGDSELASERLAVLARIFEPAMRTFLGRAARPSPALALDLGCGPGHTTETIAATLAPGRTVGLDRSPSFIEQARERASAGLEFVRHDVTSVPFPARPADLVFARLLLSHLPEPELQLQRWCGELAPGGVLLVEEVEAIETGLVPLVRYLILVAERMRRSGGELYLGPRLGALGSGPGLRRLSSEAVRVEPATAEAAAMFRLNLRAMRAAGRLDQIASPSELDLLGHELDELLRSTARGEIVWTLREVVFAPA